MNGSDFLKTVRGGCMAAALITSLAGCAGDLRTNRDLAAERSRNFLAAHPDTPTNVAADIAGQRARVGMTMDQVIAAWGRPAHVNKYRGGAQQHWFFGCDWPHHCSDSDETFPMPDEIFSSQVIFENGVTVDVRS